MNSSQHDEPGSSPFLRYLHPVPLCTTTPPPVDGATYSFVAINMISCFVNVFHMIVLSRMSLIKRTGYYHVLMHLSVANLLYALTTTLRLCIIQEPAFKSTPLAAIIVYYVICMQSYSQKYWIVLAAAVERYYALCRPLSYKTSRVTRHLGVWLPLLWCANTMTIACTALAFSEYFCFSESLGPTTLKHFGFTTVLLVITVIPAAISGGLMVRVIIELVRVRKKTLTSEEKQVKVAIIYLIIAAILFYICYVIPVINIHVYKRVGDRMSPLLFHINHFLFMSLYGFFSVLIYGWLFPAYRQRVLSILTSSSHNSTETT